MRIIPFEREGERRRATRWLAVLGMALAAACATPSARSLTDGRGEQGPENPTPAPTTPLPTSVVDAGITLPIDGAASPVPAISGLAPSSALVGGVAPTIMLSGVNFVSRTVIALDGAPLPTSFVSGTSLSATLPASALAASGTHAITAFTSAPGGGTTAPTSFTIDNPLATLASITPDAALLGAANTTVTVTGSGFVSGSAVTFGGVPLATAFLGATQLSAVIPSASLTTSGSVPIVVSNPAPGGGLSTRIAFTVANPTVTVTAIAPSTAVVGSPAATITATGTGFVSGSVASFNGAALPTTVTGATALTASVPATALATTGNFPFVVTNPAPGGGVSLPVTFTVGNPDPAITTLSPSSATAGAPPTAITISGTGFVAASQVAFAGTPTATTYASSTSLTATLTAAQLAAPGTVSVTVVNPAPGGGTSARVLFTVNNPAPVLTSISPSSVTTGAADTTLTAFGSSFVSGSTVQASGAALATTYVSATELRAVVPAASLGAATTIPITVANPDPGGSSSGPQTLTVADPTTTTSDDAGMTCDPTGVTVALSATGAAQTITLDYAYGPEARFYYDPTDPTAYACPVAELSENTSSYAAIVVQNTSGAPAYLEANADCASTDVAFLALYAGATTIPKTSAERMACTGFVANGTSGGGQYSSTSAAGSAWCPGVTKANGGALTLQPCDTAVILVQPYDVTQFTEPAQMDIDLAQ